MIVRRVFLPVVVALLAMNCLAQQVTVTGSVSMATPDSNKGKAADAANVAVWLVPADGTPLAPLDPNKARPRLVQHNKSFEPHVLIVKVGSQVEFPNRDPFFHNVFSLFDGKRFDLGLYEAGTTRNVQFDKPGISYIFCNIHAEMSAVVIAVNTPYYAVSDRKGQIIIPNVAPGRYVSHVWYEAAMPESLPGLSKEITVSENNSTLGTLRLSPSKMQEAHKNMYGHDYPPPAPATPGYQRP
jgi:plastocyanin